MLIGEVHQMLDISEIEKIVTILNDEFFEQNESFILDYGLRVELLSCGEAKLVRFLDHNLWNDVDDERDWITEEEQEPLEYFLRREINEMLVGLKTLRLKRGVK